MKYNYPVKFAVMPIIEPVGWSYGLHELEKEYDVVCYIVSKCYLLSDRTKFKENGKSEQEYEVVFPYQQRQYNNFERVVPSHTNSDLVEKVFDNYEEALELAIQKNKKLFGKTLAYLPYTNDLNNQISAKKQEFNDRLSRYKMLEQQILINTSDLEPSNVKELNNLVLSNKGKIKVLSSSLYEYLNYSTYSEFIVYSTSLKEYDEVVSLINNKGISDVSKFIKNATPILYHKAKEEDIMVINKNGNVLYFINEWGTLKSNEEQKIPSIELGAIDNETELALTTETFEDIVLSFNELKYINQNEIQGPVLKKTLF